MKKLTPSQRAMLESIRDTGMPFAHLVGVSESRQGGAAGTLRSLYRRGLAEDRFDDQGRCALTVAGEEAIKPPPRIVRFLESDYAPGASCPHCGCVGALIFRFVLEDGTTGGAMSGCIKLFPQSPVAQLDARLRDKSAKYARTGMKLASWDRDRRDAIDRFYDGAITEAECLRLCRDAESRAKAFRSQRYSR